MISSLIPTEIGLLSNLEVLDFGSNELYGRIPTQIGQMTALGKALLVELLLLKLQTWRLIFYCTLL
jgi:hypothetical protein